MQALTYTPRTLDEAPTEIPRLRQKKENKAVANQLKAPQEKYAKLSTSFGQLSVDYDRVNYELDELQRVIFGTKRKRPLPPSSCQKFP